MRKTSKYAARRKSDPMAAMRALSGARASQSNAPISRSQRTDLAVAYHGAIKAIQSGTGSWDDANTLALACNITMLLAEVGMGREYLPQILAAQDAIVVMGHRGEATGRWLFDGPGLAAVNELLEIHDAQLESVDCTESLLLGVLTECKRRISAKQVLSVAAKPQAKEAEPCQ